MPYQDHSDTRVRARQIYVEQGITNFSTIADLVNASRQTISKWAKDEQWGELRSAVITSPMELANKMKRILAAQVTAIEEMQANDVGVSPQSVKLMLTYATALRKIDQDFDVNGNMIFIMKKFAAYLQTINKKELASELAKVLPGFFVYMEKD